MKKISITWVIAHEPAYLFYRVAEDFKNIVNDYCKDYEIVANIYTDLEYNSKFNPDTKVDRHNLSDFLKSNEIQIAQMQTSSLARKSNPEMNILDLPYLFTDHKHAERVLDGEVGDKLLNSFTDHSSLRGLAFTYSGGFRLMPFALDITELSQAHGSNIRSGRSPIAQTNISALGFTPIPTEIDEVTDAVVKQHVIGAEHVAQRLFPDNCESWIKTIIDTEHSLFLTSIVVNKQWFSILPQEVQTAFLQAAKKAAANERKLSIKDGLESLEKMKSAGVKIIRLTSEEKQKLKSKTQKVYVQYDSIIDKDLLQKISSEASK
jgi:TRAP-type C4-dicarboxylate transport system substrate-binding protein